MPPPRRQPVASQRGGVIVSLHMSGYDDVLGKLVNFVKYSKRDASLITKAHAKKLEASVKHYASGRPGPNVITGQYRSSIKGFVAGPFEAGVKTDEPYAMRLEYGFVGVDSLGRHYHQPAHPHFQPAADKAERDYNEAMSDAVRSWWK